MMKSKHSLATYASLIIGVAVLTSCGEDNGNTTPTQDPVIPVTPDEKEAMTPDEQKEYIEKVAIEFLNDIPSSDFKEISELGKYIADTYGSNYDWDNVGDWAEDIFDAAREALGESKESETEEWSGTTHKYNYFYTNYKSIIMASNFKGHFTAKNGKWYLTPADDLQFIFKNSAGEECVLKLAISGNMKKIHAFDHDDWYDGDWVWEENGNTISNDYYNRTQYTIGIPENTVITLSQRGSIVAKATIKIDLGSIANEEFDISKNSFTGSALVELNNGYKFNTAQVAYTANTKASMVFEMNKNDISLISLSAAADVNDIPSCNLSAFNTNGGDIDNNTDDTNAKNTFVKLDIIKKIQIQGTLSDVRKFVNYMEQAEENETNESMYKSYINQANAITDINLFYDGTAVKQAKVRFEPFADETWSGKTYWTTEPVLIFYDGSSYSTFEAFFNETDFKKLIDTFKTLTDQYEDLVKDNNPY